jgi:hypothetical protein
MKALKTALVFSVVGVVFSFVLSISISTVSADDNLVPAPTLRFYLINTELIQIMVVDGQYKYDYHICPSSLNRTTGNKLSSGQDEYKCDSMKLSHGSFATYYKLPSNSSESFSVMLEERSTGIPSSWSNWQHFTNTYKPYAYTPSVLPWNQSGCDDLAELNEEWRDIWRKPSDDFYKWLADSEVKLQNTYGEMHNLGCNNKLNWKIQKVKAKQFIWQYTLCADGWKSRSTGSGTCSWHGGEYEYRGYYKTITINAIQFYWVN